jgi:hypothetical protein
MDLVYACHVKNNYWYHLINYNLSKIIKYCKNIYLVYSISDNVNSDIFEKNIIYKNIKFIKVENEGYDFKKYKIGLLSMNLDFKHDWNLYLNRYPDLKQAFGSDLIAAEKHWRMYGKAEGRNCQLDTNKYVILMNDSFIFSRNIGDIIDKINEKINNNVKFIGLNRSYECKEHYQSFFWILNYNLIPILCNLLTNDRLDASKGSFNIIMKCEVELSNLFIKTFKSDYIYHTNSDNLLLDGLVKLLDNEYPIIKFQCLKRVKYSLDDKNKIIDFNPIIYKELNNDLKHMSNKELLTHFFDHGINEGRKYKFSQESHIPKNIKILLDKTNLPYKYFI